MTSCATAFAHLLLEEEEDRRQRDDASSPSPSGCVRAVRAVASAATGSALVFSRSCTSAYETSTQPDAYYLFFFLVLVLVFFFFVGGSTNSFSSLDEGILLRHNCRKCFTFLCFDMDWRRRAPAGSTSEALRVRLRPTGFDAHDLLRSPMSFRSSSVSADSSSCSCQATSRPMPSHHWFGVGRH